MGDIWGDGVIRTFAGMLVLVLGMVVVERVVFDGMVESGAIGALEGVSSPVMSSWAISSVEVASGCPSIGLAWGGVSAGGGV